MKSSLQQVISMVFTLTHSTVAFIVPGVSPNEYSLCKNLQVLAVKLTSVKTQLAYEYYSLPMCGRGVNEIYEVENLGEVLRGDRIVTTSFQFYMRKPYECKILCNEKQLSINDQKMIFSRIEQSYRVHLLLDNLPVATATRDSRDEIIRYENGYSLGFFNKTTRKAHLNNHLMFTVKYYEVNENLSRVVGFEVSPRSLAMGELVEVKTELEDKTCKPKELFALGLKTCKRPDGKADYKPLMIPENPTSELNVLFTYSVEFEKSYIAWASRWDIYLRMPNSSIHWFSILNSLVTIFILAALLASILIGALRKDIARYNMTDDETTDDVIEDGGWKLLHGDIFRTPSAHELLCALVGSGVQLFALTAIIIGTAMLGMLSPASRGMLMTATILSYFLVGGFAGYLAGRLYRTWNGANWRRAALLTSALLPGVIMTIGFFVNMIIWAMQSSGAIPFTTMIGLLALWLGLDVPLTFLGFYIGYRKQAYSQPTRCFQIPRPIRDQPWYLSPLIPPLVGGVIPFGVMFLELSYILSALWMNQFYYLFGFLFLVFVILTIACSQISMVVVYFQLCAEDYRWWWKSFSISAGSALYLLMYSYYLFTTLETQGITPIIIYVSYSILLSFAFWILTGSIGFYAAYIFIIYMYSAIKVD